MTDPFEHLSPEEFQAALDPSQWSVETTLHTPSFEATLTPDGHLLIRRRGAAIAIQTELASHEVQALTLFLYHHVKMEPLASPDDFEGFPPQRADLEQTGD